ncbi:hypothetical protein DKA22_21920, partial [Salmonella enterica subsp. enterica serovar Typhi]|nr:hypothetical protein [Salmonella enterica subsp. enterica serovar Typhi]
MILRIRFRTRRPGKRQRHRAIELETPTIHCTFQEPSPMTQTLSQLENRGAFIERHIGPDAAQQQEMLNAVGAESLNA